MKGTAIKASLNEETDMKNNQHFNPDEIWESIEIPDNLNLLIINSVEEGYKRMQNKKKKNRNLAGRKAAAAVGIVVLGCVAVIPVKAFVTSLVQERMEQVPAEEIKEVESVMDAQEVNADTFSREYSDTEKERYGNLCRAYLQGTFPEGELKQEQTKTEGLDDVLYYAKDTSTFYLPGRELTDEELLQIIEFNTKRDYALEQRAQPAEVTEEEKQAREQIAGSGGISEEKAIALGTEWLHNLYGVSEQGMELNHYLDTEYGSDGKAAYAVNFSVRSTEYYYFYFDTRDGSLLKASSSLASDFDAEAVSTAVMEEKKEKLYEIAKAVLTDKLLKENDYEKIVCAYRDEDGYLGSINRVSFIFVNKDGSACEITVNADREAFLDYVYIKDYAAYTREREEAMKKMNENTNARKGKMVYSEMEK